MHPYLLRASLGGHDLTLYTYGFLLGWAIFLSGLLTLDLAERDGIPRARAFRFCAAVVACGWVGSMIHARIADPSVAADGLSQGFTFYGAALSGTLAAVPAARLLGIPFWRIADAGAPALALAHGVGRIGCYLGGCCFGATCPESSPFGIRFPAQSPAWQAHRALGLAADAPLSWPVWPTQLVEAGWELAAAAALVAWHRRRPSREGSVVLAYFLAYGPLRVLVEPIRGDPGRGELLGVTTSTAIGLVSASVALALLLPPLARLRPLRESAP